MFRAVAEHGSVGAAAAALHITGPAVTQQLRKLEREAGTRLVEPDGRGIRLTAAGHVLAGHAAVAATAVADAERDLAALHDDAAGPLRIGSVASALRSLLPEVLHALTTRNPRLVPTVDDGEVVDLLPALRSRDLDAVLLESWTQRPARLPAGVRVTALVTEPAQLAVPAEDPLTGPDPVPLRTLTGRVWASGPTGTEPYEALLQLLRGAGAEPDIRYRVGDFATQLALVRAGLAVALLPAMAVAGLAVPGGTGPVPAGDDDGVRLLPCRPAVGRSLLLATRESDAGLPSVRALVDGLRAAAARLGPS